MPVWTSGRLSVFESGVHLIGPAAQSPFSALRPLNGALYVDLGWGSGPFVEPQFPPIFVSQDGRLPDLVDSSGHPVWSGRLVEAIASAGSLDARVIRAEVRVKGRRSPLKEPYFVVQPKRVLRGAFDLARCQVEVEPVTQGFTAARRLVLRGDVELPGPLFGVSELGELAVSPAAAQAIIALDPLGLWLEPIERFTTERDDPRPLWRTEPAPGS